MFPLCTCEQPPFHYLNFAREEIGEDHYGAEVAIETCRECNRMWLVYLIEEPHYTKSGRWWRVPITPLERINFQPQAARQFIESKDWCYIGGSFYGSPGQKKTGRIVVC